jgi:hypothetical protein
VLVLHYGSENNVRVLKNVAVNFEVITIFIVITIIYNLYRETLV